MPKADKHFEFFGFDGIEIIRINEHILAFEKHTHTSDFACSVITDGTAVFSAEGKAVILKKGDCFTIIPNLPHSITSKEPASMVSLCIKTDYLKALSESKAVYIAEVRERLSKADISREIIEKLCDTADDFFELNRYAIIDDKADCDEKNPYYSKYHYIRVFSRKQGITPHKYKLQSRIRESQKLLRSGRSSADAAAESDFYDQSHFIKRFKTVVGITPSEYKASIRNFLQSK